MTDDTYEDVVNRENKRMQKLMRKLRKAMRPALKQSIKELEKLVEAYEIEPALICPSCGHSINVHNAFNCTFAFEKEHECHCGWGRALITATHERDDIKMELDKLISLMDDHMVKVHNMREENAALIKELIAWSMKDPAHVATFMGKPFAYWLELEKT